MAHELTHTLQQRDDSLVLQRAEVDDNPTFCFPEDGSPKLQDVGSVLNDWIAAAQAYGQQSSLDVPTAINDELARLSDPLATVAEQRIADLPRGQVRHVSIEESRYRVRPELRTFYRRRGKSPVAPVINLCGVCVGSDKVGHFFQQGGEYFRIGEALRERIRTWTFEERMAFLNQIAPGDQGGGSSLPPLIPEDRIIEIYTDEFGKWLEGFPNHLSNEEMTWIRSNELIPRGYFSGIYGWASSGVMSRGDLEANRQGGRFYRDAMRHPDMRLNICQYVNDNWNEYSNPSSYGGVGLFTPISGPELPMDSIGDGPSEYPVLEPSQGIIAEIPFNTASTDPDDAAMETLTSKLIWSHRDSLIRGEYQVSFVGHASRTGDDFFNQTLSEQRAQTVRGRLEFLIGEALENIDFQFDDAQSPVVGRGEERARQRGRPPEDNSQSDRVVEVVFKVI
jgi:outer membrane protein OmpA-like peptidoglycan-associated protein